MISSSKEWKAARDQAVAEAVCTFVVVTPEPQRQANVRGESPLRREPPLLCFFAMKMYSESQTAERPSPRRIVPRKTGVKASIPNCLQSKSACQSQVRTTGFQKNWNIV